MSEQDDERWITERFRAGDGFREIASAAIARGYERGKAEGTADRDRLAKRCEEFGQALDASNRKLGPLLREAAKRGDDPNADRLAALEQRVGELVEITRGCVDESIEEQDALARLAALRAPGMATTTDPPMNLAQKVHDALARAGCIEVPLLPRALPSYIERALATARRERDRLLAQRNTALEQRDTARRERDEALAKVEAQRVTGEAQVDRDVRVSAALKDALGEDGHTHEFDVAIRKITRQRDEALGVVRRYLDWDPKWGDLPKGTLRGIKLDMRALVAGQPVAESKLDAIMTEREADLIGESLATERGLRDQIATRDAEIERLQERCRDAAHVLVDAVGSATPANIEELTQRAATEIETLRAKLAEAEAEADAKAKADFQHSMRMATQLDNGRHILQGAGIDMYSKSLEAGIRELAEKRGAYVSAKLFDDHAAAVKERDTLRAHALKLDGLCERALSDDVTGMKWGRFAADLRARGEVPR